MISVLQNVKNIKLRQSPFPYFIIDDALPSEIYKELSESFPNFQKIISENRGIQEYKDNTAYRLNASQSLKDSTITDNWKRFIAYHTSSAFTEELFEILKNPIKEIFKVGKEHLPNQNNIGVRFDGEHFFNTDCQFVINTPTQGDTAVIPPHLDNPKEFYAGLLYMKDPNDDSTGGSLTTHKFKKNPSFYGKARVREENIELIEEIEYKANRLVVFLNSPHSIHGVTKRSKTNFYRKYMNIIGEFNKGLFDYTPFLEK